MNLSKQEAQESLTEIESAIARTRRAMGLHGGHILMIWGIVWAIGFATTQFCPRDAGWVWLALDIFGFGGTWICAVKSRARFHRPGPNRVGLAWLVLFGYFVLWNFLLQPVNEREGIAFSVTVFMCAYVIMGLWLSRVLLWLGLAVTALTLAGFYFLPAWFPLWTAITGGGALFFSGLYIHKSWK